MLLTPGHLTLEHVRALTGPERLDVSMKSAMKIEALSEEILRIKKKVEGTLTFDDLIVRGEGMQRVVTLGKRAAVGVGTAGSAGNRRRGRDLRNHTICDHTCKPRGRLGTPDCRRGSHKYGRGCEESR